MLVKWASFSHASPGPKMSIIIAVFLALLPRESPRILRDQSLLLQEAVSLWVPRKGLWCLGVRSALSSRAAVLLWESVLSVLSLGSQRNVRAMNFKRH